MGDWLNLGQNLEINAKKYANKIALKDKARKFTYSELNSRVNKLAQGLLSFGFRKGDKLAVLLENCIEIVEVYLAAAKTGIIVVPVNFRLVAPEIEYILNHSDSKGLIVHEEFVPVIEKIKPNLKNIKKDSYFVVGKSSLPDYMSYDEVLKTSPDIKPQIEVRPKDTWILLYTSGTTGVPKGVVRSHESYIAFYLINSIDFGFNENDICLNVMPLCHVNSTFFSFTFTYIGATIYIHPARSFNPVEILELIDKEKITFISLIPTHYSLILSVPKEEAKKYNLSSLRKLLCSSAPVRGETKKAIMNFFPGVELYEGYGSTEAGIVTVLKPEDQLRKLGSIGRESLGTDLVKILDENGNEVKVGEVGELYSKGPMMFDEYYKNPEKTKSSFRGDWFTAGDLAKVDEDGFFYIVDRKDNMIITGGEKVYPSEVEEIIAKNEKVFDVAVIGVPDEKWGEAVKAVVVLKNNEVATREEIIEFCRGKMAGYKKPKSVDFIKNEDMPRSVTGKILYRELRKRYR
ncbi:MAG: AMP-binding protein [Candidatus Thermoplasmatota archaeon]